MQKSTCISSSGKQLICLLTYTPSLLTDMPCPVSASSPSPHRYTPISVLLEFYSILLIDKIRHPLLCDPRRKHGLPVHSPVAIQSSGLHGLTHMGLELRKRRHTTITIREHLPRDTSYKPRAHAVPFILRIGCRCGRFTTQSHYQPLE